MQRMHVWAMAILTPIFGLGLALNMGCGSKSSDGTTEVTKSKDGKETTKAGGKGEKAAVDGNYSGTLTGKVTFKGAPPNEEKANSDLLAQMEKTDKPHCVDQASPAERTQQQWVINKDGGVANVFVWIQPVDTNHYFKVDKSKKTWEDKVVLDQPHCAFVPHALVMFTQYYDPDSKKKDKKEKTGQVLLVKNSADINHNTNTGEENQIIPSKSEKEFKVAEINKDVPIKCNIHGWMTGHIWAFEHPYAAVTKEDGTYEIKNVPAGATVRVIAWHEADGFIGDKKGKEVKLDEKTTENFELGGK
ncbi:MAG: hypothetical protein ACJ8FY_11700 [Gemmataceae bacterium]